MTEKITKRLSDLAELAACSTSLSCTVYVSNLAVEAGEAIEELEAALDQREIDSGLTSDGNLWRFWAGKAKDAVARRLEAEAEVERLKRENEALAAHQCLFLDGSGLTGGEGGTPVCLKANALTAISSILEKENTPVKMPIGTHEGSPYPGMSPPHPRLTHWVCWDGGFWAWAWPLLDRGHMVLVAAPGEDAFVLGEGERWGVGVIDLTTIESVLDFEASTEELPEWFDDFAANGVPSGKGD